MTWGQKHNIRQSLHLAPGTWTAEARSYGRVGRCGVMEGSRVCSIVTDVAFADRRPCSANLCDLRDGRHAAKITQTLYVTRVSMSSDRCRNVLKMRSVNNKLA